MLPRRFQRLIHDFDDRFHLDPLRLAGVEIFNAFEPPIQVRHIIFGNIRPQRIRRAFAGQCPFLQCDLSLARQQPVDKNLGRVRVWRTIYQGQGTKLLNQTATFFEHLGTKCIHRQTLSLQNVDIAEKTNRELSRRQPIRTLAEVTKQRYVHLANELANESGTEIGVMVKEARVACTGSCFTDIPRLDLAFPFRVQQIPIRFEVLNVDELRVVVDGSVRCRADILIVEDVLAFRIRVLVCF
jgi:hypothetical protein